ncbi:MULTISPECIES: Clp protease N-terminal domain-containing protein [Kitasatospora]|uniref:Clp R domain-containing protein n=1 Tax=Kitasatospora cystarginea TaxID=58350 RepID=A0ABN3F2J3_9ACTN
MSAIDGYLHAIIVRAIQEAREDGSATIEAHHLLLAIAADNEATTHRILTTAGLDRRAVRDALDWEFEHSLRAVGVSPAACALPRPSPVSGQPKIGASARLALERSFASVRRKKELRPAHLLLGILQAQVGTVPRALALAAVDQDQLVNRVQQALSSEDA